MKIYFSNVTKFHLLKFCEYEIFQEHNEPYTIYKYDSEINARLEQYYLKNIDTKLAKILKELFENGIDADPKMCFQIIEGLKNKISENEITSIFIKLRITD